MKDETVGNGQELLLWPEDMRIFDDKQEKTNPLDQAMPISESKSDSKLLWPTTLVNEQTSSQNESNNHLNTLAIITFAISCMLGVVIGPLLLTVIAITNNYAWATTLFYGSMLRAVFLIAAIVAIMNIVILALLFRQPNFKQHTTLALVSGSLLEIGLVLIFSYFMHLTPSQLMVALFIGTGVILLAVILVNKQNLVQLELSIIPKVIIGIFVVFATIEIGLSGFYLINSQERIDESEIKSLVALQEEARLDGVAEDLSNLVYTLCNGRYGIVYLSEFTRAGLFECVENGEVYSVAEDTLDDKRPTGGATYLGTTKDIAISIYFPNAYYLYRSLPQVLSEDELALMLPAASEQELVDNLAPMLLNYWQNNNQHNLYLNVFYNSDVNQIFTTKDYILMSALGTMVMVEGLPKGMNLRGIANNAITDYLFHADMELAALNELGGAPDLYATSTREALMTNRHISIHLKADEVLDAESLTARLWDSFTGGI